MVVASQYRMLVVDLDGTALTHDDRITDADRAAAEALVGQGVVVTIATGRLWAGTRPYTDALGVTGVVAVMNGSELVDCGTEVVRDGRYLDGEARSHVRALFAAFGMSSFVYGSSRIHYGEGDERYTQFLGAWTPDLVCHPRVLDAPAWADDDVLAVAAAGDAARIDALRAALHEHLSPDCEMVVFPTWTGDTFLKVRNARENKGTALTRMAADHGIPVSATVAVGDWYNDVPMLRTAGRSYAMGDSGDDVRAAATETLSSTRHGGGAIAEIAAKVWGVHAG